MPTYNCTATTDCTWGYWCRDITSTSTNDSAWSAWTITTHKAVYETTNTADAWSAWTNAADNYTIVVDAWREWNTGPQRIINGAPAVHTRRRETEEERIAREEADVRRRAAEAERVAAQQVINGRAEQLLLSLMSPEQKRDWAASGHFFLHMGDRRYRIERGRHGNVYLVNDKNEVLERFCALPSGDLPAMDVMAGQLLTLQHDEEQFIRTAASSMVKDGHTPLKKRLKEQGHLRLAA